MNKILLVSYKQARNLHKYHNQNIYEQRHPSHISISVHEMQKYETNVLIKLYNINNYGSFWHFQFKIFMSINMHVLTQVLHKEQLYLEPKIKRTNERQPKNTRYTKHDKPSFSFSRHKNYIQLPDSVQRLNQGKLCKYGKKL